MVAMTAAAGVRRVVPLTFGWEAGRTSRSRCRWRAPRPTGGSSNRSPGVLVVTDDGWVLLYNRLQPGAHLEPRAAAALPRQPRFRPILPGPGEPLEAALTAAGVAVDDIATVAFSHLHNDHAGGVRHFAGRVPVHCSAPSGTLAVPGGGLELRTRRRPGPVGRLRQRHPDRADPDLRLRPA